MEKILKNIFLSELKHLKNKHIQKNILLNIISGCNEHFEKLKNIQNNVEWNLNENEKQHIINQNNIEWKFNDFFWNSLNINEKQHIINQIYNLLNYIIDTHKNNNLLHIDLVNKENIKNYDYGGSQKNNFLSYKIYCIYYIIYYFNNFLA